VQSEHWSTDSYTLVVGVAVFLDGGAWNATVGPLDVGAEVTVAGEVAGEERAAGFHWARAQRELSSQDWSADEQPGQARAGARARARGGAKAGPMGAG
jgi:hypothetical protein